MFVFVKRGLQSIGIALALGVVPLLSGCLDSRGGPIPYNQQLATPDEPKIESLGAGYKIAPMDTLTVKVFKADDLTGDYDVDLAGNISLPLIGEVQAATLTTAQLDEKLTERFGEKYFQNPDVSVAVKKSTGRVVTVDGAVKEPGAFPLIQPVSLMQAVAMAKGVTEEANLRRVAVFRTIDGQRQAAAFDLTSIRRGEMQDPQVYPGDIIIVDGSHLKQIQKQILSNIPILSVFRPF